MKYFVTLLILSLLFVSCVKDLGEPKYKYVTINTSSNYDSLGNITHLYISMKGENGAIFNYFSLSDTSKEIVYDKSFDDAVEYSDTLVFDSLPEVKNKFPNLMLSVKPINSDIKSEYYFNFRGYY